jgi:predicted 3-demethylubiquinone-9 3-methyltransferase (glyoxalase superfamily)
MTMATVNKIVPCLWFDNQAEDAAKFYASIFKNSEIKTITRYGKAGYEIHKRPEGSVMTVSFTLEGQEFTALNGGPLFKLSEAISFEVRCKDQAEIDYFWEKLGQGGDPKAQQCGWLKDKFGLSWQIVPADWVEMMRKAKPDEAERLMTAILQMKKFDIAAMKRAQAGK